MDLSPQVENLVNFLFWAYPVLSLYPYWSRHPLWRKVLGVKRE